MEIKGLFGFLAKSLNSKSWPIRANASGKYCLKNGRMVSGLSKAERSAVGAKRVQVKERSCSRDWN